MIEYSDDTQGCTAVRADEGMECGGVSVKGKNVIGCTGVWVEDAEQLTSLSQVLDTAGVGDEAVVTDAVETGGQDMDEEATD